MRKLFVFLTAILLALALPTTLCGAAGAAGPAPGAVLLTAAEETAVALVNADRTAAGLKPLKVNPALIALARAHADDMLARDYVSHVSPDGESPFDRMRRYGVDYTAAGENLAMHGSVAAAHELLMASEGHRKNILDPDFTEVGIGVRPGPRGTVYVVQEFIGR